MLKDINYGQISYVSKLGLSLSHMKYLEDLFEGKDPPRDKFYRKLESLGMVVDDVITPHGRNYYSNFLKTKGVLKKTRAGVIKKGLYTTEFLEWWETYPSSDNFEYQGEIFSGVRGLRTKKDECSAKYELVKQELGHQMLLDCLKYEVDSRIDQSSVRGENLLTFMKATISYLNNRGFEPYVPLVSKYGKYKTKQKNEFRKIDTEGLF